VGAIGAPSRNLRGELDRASQEFELVLSLLTGERVEWKETGMNALVKDVMNGDLLYLREGERLDIARHPILEFGVTAVPVLDDKHRPVGVVSLRDLMAGAAAKPSTPAWSIAETATVEEAARVMSEASFHHLVVVNGQGIAVGMVSALDLLRALAGLPSQHPRAFARFNEAHPRA
jgi:CBS domain-containing protein